MLGRLRYTASGRRVGQVQAWLSSGRHTPAKYLILDEQRGSVEVDLIRVEEDMDKVVQDLSAFFLKTNSGRVNKGMFEQIMVQSDQKKKTPLTKYGTLVIKDAQNVVLSLYDASSAKCVLSALQQADLNLTAQLDGGKIFVTMPKLTVEIREKLAKSLSSPAEKAKASIRDIRSALIRSLDSRVKDLNLRRQAEQAAQGLYEKFMAHISTQLEAKQREVLSGPLKK